MTKAGTFLASQILPWLASGCSSHAFNKSRRKSGNNMRNKDERSSVCASVSVFHVGVCVRACVRVRGRRLTSLGRRYRGRDVS